MTKIRKEQHPIEFSIENQFQKSPALYILENPQKQKERTELHFTFKNTSEQTFELEELHGLGEDNCHFELIFRSGVLRYEEEKDIQSAFSTDKINQGKWWMSPLYTNKRPGHEVLYFGRSKQGNLTLAPGESFTVKAIGLAAIPTGGSRSTQVQVKYRFPIKGQAGAVAEGICHHHLDIFNHVGESYAPIVAGMLGLDELLSTHRGEGASKSQLTVKNDFSVFLTSSEPGEQLDLAANTQIELRFPYYAGSKYNEGMNTPTFVLGNKTEVAGIKITNKTIRDAIARIKQAGEEEKQEITKKKNEDVKDAEAEAEKKIDKKRVAFEEEDGKKTSRYYYRQYKVTDKPGGERDQKMSEWLRWNDHGGRKEAAQKRDEEIKVIKANAKIAIDKIKDKAKKELADKEEEIAKKIDEASPALFKEGEDIETDTLTYKVTKIVDLPSKDGTWGQHVLRLGLKEATQLTFLRIDFTDLVVSGGNENSRIFLAVRNIPGYRDADLELTVNKTNMVMKGHRTGIRISDPQEELHVEGNALVDGQVLIGKPEKLAAAKEAFDKEYQNKDQDDSAIIFAPHQNYPDHAWIRFHSRSGAAHNLEIQVKQSEHGTDHLALQPQGGKVGIGTQEPTEALEVNGRVKDQTGYLMPVGSIIAYGGEDIPEGWLECNGQAIPVGGEFKALKDALGAKYNAKTPDLRSRFVVGLENREIKVPNDLVGDQKFSVLHKSEGFPSINKRDLLGKHAHSLKGLFYSIKATLSAGSGSVKVLKEESSAAAQKTTGGAGDTDQNALAPKIIPPYYVLRYIIKY